MAVTTQVRTYTVKEGLLDEWVRRWREEIVPLRLEFGFSLGGAWIERERHHFLWEISYAGPETFAERNRQYWDSPKREAMALDPDDYLVSTEVREVTRVY
ncbi:NIPSNAP family containing protein [Nocardiopsis tropica]|uniref:NIPSNAP family containing protein n=1 Tax=Nocardiopsis tropica TaxID=109330 RepID=A0ABU7KI86_9ACTN|nr:NIPSNAP family containing protein [Nocardiopsis umidischolae]MEE2049010.1 NIPSNAP family containing protein [Nocardiopsis umidischolae]